MRKRISVIFVAAVTLSAVVLLAPVGWTVCFDYFRYSYRPSLAFDSIRWKNDLKYRHSVTGAVASRVIRPGISKAQVEKLLGQPDTLGENGVWNYGMKRPGYHPGQPRDLGVQIAFDSLGRVSSVIDERWVE